MAVLLNFKANAQALGLLWVLLREEVSVFWLLGDLLVDDLLQNFDFGNLDATVVYFKLAWVSARRRLAVLLLLHLLSVWRGEVDTHESRVLVAGAILVGVYNALVLH